MSKLKASNIKKAYRYLKKNGIVPAFYACLERLGREKSAYRRPEPSEAELENQRAAFWRTEECFSILVPAYETDPIHFHEMVDSVLYQTYPKWELIIADASPSDKVQKEMLYYKDSRIKYLPLEKNDGISENTNRALEHAGGSYIGLLDHDDVLEPDALYQMMLAIQEKRRQKIEPKMLYSDEDKCNGDMTEFYEPHYKGKFNLDLIMSNNYICHFLVMKAELMKELGFRKEYDGAQDHDLVLRASARLLRDTEEIVHVPHILYHWRCHTGSTAENPESKMYAYEAGRRAVEDFCGRQGWNAKVVHTKHLGFFRTEYYGDILEIRSDLAAIGGRLISGGKITGGAYDEAGVILYRNLNKHFSGYMHHAALQQDVYAVDVRNIRVSKGFQAVYEKIMREEADPETASMRLGREAKEQGCRILWDPHFEMKKKN